MVVAREESVLSIRKITEEFKGARSVTKELSFVLDGESPTHEDPKTGKQCAHLKIYLMCDSYIGYDLWENFNVEILK